MKKIFIILVLILVACNVQAENNIEPLDMHCNIVESKGIFGVTIYRCENQEVICYIYDGYREGGISCKFKDKGI